MIFITLSVVQSVLILITFKLFDRYRIDNLQAIVVNYIVAGTFGFAISRTEWTPATLAGFDWFFTALILGVMFICTFFLFALSSQKIGVAVTSVTSKMSLVIPMVAGVFLFGEPLWIPLLVFAGNGMVDTTMKYADHHFIRNDLILFLAVVFSTSFLIGSSILIIRLIYKKVTIQWKHIGGGVFLGMINFGSTYYMLKAISVFESSVVFPVTNAAIVGLSGLAGFFGFREKLTWINWLGIVLAVLAILIIAKS